MKYLGPAGNMNPKVDVIIPVYGVESYLAGCISSVLAQSYGNINIILVDDGSPDNCPAICDSYASLYENIEVIHKQNGGLSDARNAGLDKAKGDYVLFLDSDDTLEPYSLEHLVSIALDQGCDVVMPDRYSKVWPGAAPKLCFHFSGDLFISDPRKFAAEVMICRGRAWRASSLLYKRELIEESKARFPLGMVSEDFPFNLEILSNANRIGFLEESTLNYLQRSGSITGSFHSDYFDMILYIDDISREFLLKQSLDVHLADSLLSRNAIVYLTEVFGRYSGLSRSERDDYFKTIVFNHRVNEALKTDFGATPFFSSKLAGRYCLEVRRLLCSRRYRSAKALLHFAGLRK